MPSRVSSPAPEDHWAALMKAQTVETECALVNDPATDSDQIVVLYNARNAPPVITIDADDKSELITLRADGTPLAVLTRLETIPSADDVMLVARHS